MVLNRNRIFARFMAVALIIGLLAACSNGTVQSLHSDRELALSQKKISGSSLGQSKDYDGPLELPIRGATGYASIDLALKTEPGESAQTERTMKAGTGFEILNEEGEWWYIKRGDVIGWLPHHYCFINLPDVIPSIIYDNTNTYSSMFTSSGYAIPNVTNQMLYSGKSYNKRLGKEEFIMPVLYSMSKKVHAAQQHALADGNSLKMYEAYRPYSVQKKVVNELTALAKQDAAVKAGINTPPWGITWFITDGVSNHQMGYAIDVSLSKVKATSETTIGHYSVTEITDYTEYQMPTRIHELSGSSAIFTLPVNSNSPTAWKNATYTSSMNEAAINLQRYSTAAGLTPLASEWWHFNDLEAREQILDRPSQGHYSLTEVYSSPPVK
ncbi:D-alanyl-D-alanine carboxypeptidase family protein [Aureibacillus halotolerans]|uniref:D-alanyl-D-alanine dipeptidase n=1 Tax=Aureibacillus halotolerans TaxID=1508390 RepID=A0A4R6UC53_9BACI|nr:D-alanyl-D-alanine carboxypeptidase family protein [Aureibacillus halotolerans]TDQ42663.1 D-alanyl-D-alanine dipeptidase [Aureibacillus halotolerans]